MAVRFPMHPVGTNSAASFPKISAARFSSWLTVGSSPYTSSPTSASAIARRISGVGRVTVSLRRSTTPAGIRSEEHTSELQSRLHLVCRLLLEKKNDYHVMSQRYH